MDLYQVCSYDAPWAKTCPIHRLEHMTKEDQLQNSSRLKLEGVELGYLSLYELLSSLFTSCPGSQNWPHPGGHKLWDKENQLQNYSSLKLEGLEL